jgi:hypothetical protein
MSAKFLLENLNGKKSLVIHRHRWEDSVKIDLKEMRFKGLDWIQLVHDMVQWQTLVNTVKNLRFP